MTIDPAVLHTNDRELFNCPLHRIPLHREAEAFVCTQCGVAGRVVRGVVSFLLEPDHFYEGKYNNRTKYIPRNDGLLATLPLRVVLQGYPTAVARELPAGATLLEIGCAGGIDWFGQRYRMIGLDLSQSALETAAKTYTYAVQGRATTLPLADASVDEVISSCLFEHLSPEDKRTLLKECHRVLRPAGKLVFFYDIETDNPVIALYRRHRPDLYQKLFLDGDAHIGYENIDANREHYHRAGLRITSEVFHERSPVLANSAWQKLSQWPGALGRLASIGKAVTSGPARLPSLALIAVVDGTIGRALPQRHARGLTTIAMKP